jgi:multidrug efflux system membrane fusion protein
MKTSILIATLLAVVAAGWIASGQIGSSEPQPAQSIAATPPDVQRKMSVRVREIVARPLVREVTITGETQASRHVEMRAETEGQIEQVLVRRGDRVREGDIIAKLRIDERSARLAEHKARLRQRQIEYDAASELSDKGYRSKTNLAAASAELDAAKAVVRQMEIDIARTSLRAPFDGVVGEDHVEIGDYVKVGDIAATLIDLDPLLVVGYITEREVGELEDGAGGKVALVTGEQVDGRVTFVSPVADPATRTYRFELTVDNPRFSMRDGITARIEIPGQAMLAHFVTPAILTLNDDGIVGIKAVDDDNIVRFLPVQILADTPDGMWLGGLPEHVRAIVVGQDFVVDGEAVVPVLTDGVATDRRDGAPT